MRYSPAVHAFDRYAGYTDLAALLAYTAKPLRKSVRVNTLKSTVERFAAHAKSEAWAIAPVPWCDQGFFVERENRERALGRDMLHLLGHMYMQEASSMLPVSLLDPQPGEQILDMSAAPGSKTTQMAALMGNTGVIVANDAQEQRLWTLQSALQRCGVINAIVVKKVGQWYAKHMTERFDRVLCDAPCTAQGTARKDSDALRYCSMDNITKMARLQEELLTAAIHAAKVGGRIVYSTCTLTPEENEGVIRAILNNFGDQLSVLHPGNILKNKDIQKAVDDSDLVQRSMGASTCFPAMRVWPQTYDTEGFFSCILEKKASTRAPMKMDIEELAEKPLGSSGRSFALDAMRSMYGTPFVRDDEWLLKRPGKDASEQIVITSGAAWEFPLPTRAMAVGLPYAKRMPSDADRPPRLRISHEMATLRGSEATQGVFPLDQDALEEIFKGGNPSCPPDLRGDMLLIHDGICVGRGLAKDGIIKNALPREVVRHG